MFHYEKLMVVQLERLKSQFGIEGVKAEFEAEGSGFNDIARLRRTTASLGIPLHVKIGGVEAIRDIHDCVELGVDGIIAPMVESPFGAHKFVQSIRKVGVEGKMHFSINVETQSAVNCIDGILDCIQGVVQNITIGRTDLSGSYFDPEIGPNSPAITEIVGEVCRKAIPMGFKVTMGGSLNSESVRIFRDRPEIANHLHHMESRKVIMRTNLLLESPQILKEALHFEEQYILSKKEYMDMRIGSEMSRLTNLKTRC